MRGLDWSNTPYARLYRQDTAAWKRLKWEAQAVYALLLRHLDRAGCLALDGLFPWEAVAEMTGIPDAVCERSVPALVAAGFFVEGDDKLTDPEFLDREEATMSGAQRKRDERARRRDKAISIVYFLLDDEAGLVKIGYTTHLAGRTGELSRALGRPLTLIMQTPGGKSREAEIHDDWAEYRHSGEWFRFTGALKEALESHNVTKSHASSRAVTGSHAESQGVTPSLPSLPSESPKTDSCAKPPADGRSARVVDFRADIDGDDPGDPEPHRETIAEGFARWWPLLPPKAKKDKSTALKRWKALAPDDRNADDVVDFLDFLRETGADVYVTDGGQFLPQGPRFVKAKPWQDDRSAYPPPSGNGQGRRTYVQEHNDAIMNHPPPPDVDTDERLERLAAFLPDDLGTLAGLIRKLKGREAEAIETGLAKLDARLVARELPEDAERAAVSEMAKLRAGPVAQRLYEEPREEWLAGVEADLRRKAHGVGYELSLYAEPREVEQ